MRCDFIRTKLSKQYGTGEPLNDPARTPLSKYDPSSPLKRLQPRLPTPDASDSSCSSSSPQSSSPSSPAENSLTPPSLEIASPISSGELPWHLVNATPNLGLGKPRALAPIRETGLRTPSLSNGASAVLPWHTKQDVMMILDKFIDEERQRVTSPSQVWRPLRQVQGIKSVADLPPLRGPRKGLRDAARAPSVRFAEAAERRAAVKAAALQPAERTEQSFEALLRIHFRADPSVLLGDDTLRAMLNCAEPIFEDAKTKHILWLELGWDANKFHQQLPPTAAEQALGARWRSTIEPVRQHGIRCRVEGHWPGQRPAGKPASWMMATASLPH